MSLRRRMLGVGGAAAGEVAAGGRRMANEELADQMEEMEGRLVARAKRSSLPL